MENLEWWQTAIAYITVIAIDVVMWLISWKWAGKCCKFLQTFLNFNDIVYIVLRAIFTMLIFGVLYWFVNEIWIENSNS